MRRGSGGGEIKGRRRYFKASGTHGRVNICEYVTVTASETDATRGDAAESRGGGGRKRSASHRIAETSRCR